ncbi:hypothetical protein N8596_00395, partial [bacterium]|nr:hypothetical protein [bacterium]
QGVQSGRRLLALDHEHAALVGNLIEAEERTFRGVGHPPAIWEPERRPEGLAIRRLPPEDLADRVAITIPIDPRRGWLAELPAIRVTGFIERWEDAGGPLSRGGRRRLTLFGNRSASCWLGTWRGGVQVTPLKTHPGKHVFDRAPGETVQENPAIFADRNRE